MGGHHIARELARRGWKVAFLSNPVSPLHLAGIFRRCEARRRLHAWAAGFQRDEGTGVLHGVPLTLLPLAGRLGAGLPWVLRTWPRFTLPDIRHVLDEASMPEIDLMILDGPIQAGWIDRLPVRRKVLRIFDHTLAFPGVRPAIAAAERDLARRVDVVAFSASSLEDYVRELDPRKMLHLPNGVDFSFFANDDRPEPPAYRTIPGPRAVYAGALADWFDFELMAGLAKALPAVSFVLIGNDTLARKRLPPLPNLHLLGPVAWKDLAPYLRHADVGLIPFAVSRYPALVDGINPLKLYEYLACGLPVAARGWRELRRLGSPARLCDTLDDFVSAVSSLIRTPPDPARLRNFAADHDWSPRVERLLGAIDLV